jgi:hypothetical protein
MSWQTRALGWHVDGQRVVGTQHMKLHLNANDCAPSRRVEDGNANAGRVF